ncbi:UNVERIFIED_CONTAM: hypothetical protein NCL1_35157 [Trichonephila clavipes]
MDALGDESPCRATVFRWFKEFCSGQNSLQDEEHTGRPRLAVIPENVQKITKKRNISESVKISLKLPNDGEHHVISKIVTGDETYMPFYDVPTRQESKVWIFEDDPTPTMVKSQRAMK